MALPSVGGITQSAEGMNGTKRWREGLSLSLLDLTSILICPKRSWFSDFQNLHHHLSGSQDYKLHRLSWGSSLQRADGISSQPPWSCEPVPYNRSLYRYMLLVPFLWRPLTNSLYWFNFHIFSDLHLSFLATSLKADTWWIFTIIFSIPIKLYYAPLIHNRHSVKTFN